MKLIGLVFLLALLFLPLGLYAQGGYRDPFSPILPPKEGEAVGPQKPSEIKGPPPVTVEGVLWGSANPQTIIDGEVYRVGDVIKLAPADAKVTKIVENVVFIAYGDHIYEMKVKKREEKR